MSALIFAPSARQDLLDIFDYIARDKPIAAANWIDKIEEKCELIATTPGIGERRPEYGPDIRSSVVGRYVIFYRPISDGIEVVRCWAADVSLSAWQGRRSIVGDLHIRYRGFLADVNQPRYQSDNPRRDATDECGIRDDETDHNRVL